MDYKPGDGIPVDGRIHGVVYFSSDRHTVGIPGFSALDAARQLTETGVHEIPGLAASRRVVANAGETPLTVRADAKSAGGIILASRRIPLSAHQSFVGGTQTIFPDVDSRTLAKVASIDYVVEGAADGRSDGSSQFGGRIIGLGIYNLVARDGTSRFLVGKKLENADPYKLKVEMSAYNPRTDENVGEHRDGQGLIDYLRSLADSSSHHSKRHRV
jgi:hypothetical protein